MNGPCPPEGSGAHRYAFTVWAIGAVMPALKPDAPADEITRTLEKAALAKATLTGTVAR